MNFNKLCEYDIMKMATIRNISIVGQIGVGKTTIINNFFQNNSLGNSTENYTNENLRMISVNLTDDCSDKHEVYEINIFDCSGHMELHHFTQTAMFLSDCVIIMIDLMNGLETDILTTIKQALLYKVKPIVVINKFDRFLFEKNEVKEICENLQKVINDINECIENCQNETEKWLENLTFSNGSIIFTSSTENWGFDISEHTHSIIEMHEITDRKSKDQEYLEQTFDNYFGDKENDEIVLFLRYYFKIKEVVEYLCGSVFEENYGEQFKIMDSGIENNKCQERKDNIYRKMLQNIFPLDSILKKIIINKFPASSFAQKYRAPIYCPTPFCEESEKIYKLIENCNVSDNLVIYTTSVVFIDGESYNLCKIFSGRVSKEKNILILKKKNRDILKNYKVKKIIQFGCENITERDTAIAGEIVGIQFCKNNTDVLLNFNVVIDCDMNESREIELLHLVKQPIFYVKPIFKFLLDLKKKEELPKLINALKILEKIDPIIKINWNDRCGSIFIYCTGHFHIKNTLDILRNLSKIGKDEIIVSNVTIDFRETIRFSTNCICLVKSPNKFNRFYFTAEPLDNNLINELESRTLNIDDLHSHKMFSETLVSRYGWDVEDSKKVWGIFPENEPSNLFVDCTSNVKFLSEIKNETIRGFRECCENGILSGEKLRGIRFNLVDATFYCGTNLRNQVLPAITKGINACVLMNFPTLYAPIFKMLVFVKDEIIEVVLSLLKNLDIKIKKKYNQKSRNYLIFGMISGFKYFSFDRHIKENKIKKEISIQLIFHEWNHVGEKYFDDLVKKIRINNGLSPEIPNVKDFLDYL